MKFTVQFARGWWLFLALALAAGGCATQVAVGSDSSEVASYQYGTLTADLHGDPPTVFHATNAALDGLGYFRVGQNVSTDKQDIKVFARAVGDYQIIVHIKQSKQEGLSTTEISYGDGNLPKSQAILAAISKQLQQGGSAPGASAYGASSAGRGTAGAGSGAAF